MTATTARQTTTRTLPSSASRRCSGVGSGSAPLEHARRSGPARCPCRWRRRRRRPCRRRPPCPCRPCSAGRPAACPRSRTPAGSLSTGADSPVRAASWTRKPNARRSRTSAGMWSPASSSTRSPGTSSRAGTACSDPVAEDLRQRGRELPEGGQGLLGPLLLEEAEQAVQEDDGQDGQRIDPLAHRARR